jgi:adenylosuccinate lyase
MSGVLLDNANHSLLERTLDDSANRREVFPVLFLAVDEMLSTVQKLVSGLEIDQAAVQRTLDRYGTFAATERLLMALATVGADRQQMHAVLRDHSLEAWAQIAAGYPNPLADRLSGDPTLTAFLPAVTIRELLDAADYVGDAPTRARAFADHIQAVLQTLTLITP